MLRNFIFYIITGFLLIPFTQIFSIQMEPDSVIAKIGTSYISINEFRERYQLTPQVSKVKNINDKKENLLYSIIAEKLWAEEAENLQLDTTEIMQTTFKLIEKMFVRDALYKSEIKNKVKISEEEMLSSMLKYFTELSVNVLYSPDSIEIFHHFELLNEGAKFDSLQSLSQYQLPPVEVKFGEMQKDIEDSLFNLKAGEYTAPVKSGTGWIIFSLNKKVQKSFTSEDVNQTLSKIKKQLEAVKTDSIYKNFKSSFFGKKKVEADGNIFWAVTDKMISIIREKKIYNNIPDTVDVRLDVQDILMIENQLGADTLKMILINLDKAPVTVKDFLRYFTFEGFYTRIASSHIIAAKINSRVKTLIEQELLAQEGYKRGLQNLPEVKHAIKMWKENYLAKIYKNHLLENININIDVDVNIDVSADVDVDEPEIENNYQSIKSDTSGNLYVNILEILTDSLEVVEKILDELENGTDFKELAFKYTKRDWAKNKGGEFGLFPSVEHGEIGRIAATMEIGEIYGPLQTPEGYSIFKLIEKKNEMFSEQTIDANKDEIKKQLRLKKLSQIIIENTVKLANKYGVHVNASLLNSISVQDFNMFAIRYMGFGGRLTAVPFTLPFTEWVDDWMRSLNEIP